VNNILLSADWHLTDNDIEKYRWNVFDVLIKTSIENQVNTIILSGDIFDRRDKHPGTLINSFINAILDIKQKINAEILILAGNHDTPLKNTYYWSFLNSIGIKYIWNPELFNDVYLLPFSPNPVEDWKELDFNNVKAIIMHQTIAGAVVDGDRVITDAPHPMPKLPDIPIYSGDIHRPQFIQGVTYIGVPHPTRFSEDWPNRFLLINDVDWSTYKEIPIESIRRCVLEISNAAVLNQTEFKKGDQLRIKFKLTNRGLALWPTEEQAIREWAKQKEVTIVSIEAILVDNIDTSIPTSNAEIDAGVELMPADQIIRTFGEEESLSQEIIDFGIKLVQECQ
jgi:DNA repair exonuclease SbcCD nuclease subunit